MPNTCSGMQCLENHWCDDQQVSAISLRSQMSALPSSTMELTSHISKVLSLSSYVWSQAMRDDAVNNTLHDQIWQLTFNVHPTINTKQEYRYSYKDYNDLFSLHSGPNKGHFCIGGFIVCPSITSSHCLTSPFYQEQTGSFNGTLSTLLSHHPE